MRATERIGLLAVLVLSPILAVLRPAGHGHVLLVLAACGAAQVLSARLGRRGGVAGLVRDAMPYAVVVSIFTHLQPAIEAVNPARYDAVLSGLDRRWLGGLVTAWRGVLGRPAPFTDAVYLVYVSFYVMPVVVLLATRALKGREAMERSSFVVLLGFHLSYVGYFLWPTSGPRVPAAEEAALGGGAVSFAIRAFLRSAEGNTLDAFPSGHTAMSLLTAHVGARAFPRVRPLLFLWSAGIIFATVYVHVHYAVDVAGGVALSLVTLSLARPVRWALEWPRTGPRPRPGADALSR